MPSYGKSVTGSAKIERRATYVVAAGDDAADELEDMIDEEVVGEPWSEHHCQDGQTPIYYLT